MIKQTQILMLPADEADFSKLLLKARPSLKFIDDNVWDSPDPALVDSIDQCKSNFCFLWDSDIAKLPIGQRKDGRFEGPIAGVVVQFVRSLFSENTLRSGRVAVSFSDNSSQMGDFARDVWKALRQVTGKRPSVVDAHTGEILRSGVTEYVIGLHAEKWGSDSFNRLKDRSAQIFFSPGEGAAGKRKQT